MVVEQGVSTGRVFGSTRYDDYHDILTIPFNAKSGNDEMTKTRNLMLGLVVLALLLCGVFYTLGPKPTGTNEKWVSVGLTATWHGTVAITYMVGPAYEARTGGPEGYWFHVILAKSGDAAWMSVVGTGEVSCKITVGHQKPVANNGEFGRTWCDAVVL